MIIRSKKLFDKVFVRVWLEENQALDSLWYYYGSMEKVMQDTLHKHSKDCLQKDFLIIAKMLLRKRKKPFSHLAFAKRTNYGYAFFETISHSAIDILHEIAQKITKLHPEYEFAFVVEVCSEFANMSEQELSFKNLPFGLK